MQQYKQKKQNLTSECQQKQVELVFIYSSFFYETISCLLKLKRVIQRHVKRVAFAFLGLKKKANSIK